MKQWRLLVLKAIGYFFRWHSNIVHFIAGVLRLVAASIGQVDRKRRMPRALVHPLLRSPDEVIEGYRIAFEKELGAMNHAAQLHPELVERWQRLLTLHRVAMVRSGRLSTELNEDENKAFKLRLLLVGMAGGTSKMALDTALFGYYNSSFGLIRHMLESWMHAAFVGFWPEEARPWFRQESSHITNDTKLRERDEREVLKRLKGHFEAGNVPGSV